MSTAMGYQVLTPGVESKPDGGLTLKGFKQFELNKAKASHGRKSKFADQKYRFQELESTTFDAFLFCTCSIVDTSMSYEKGVWLQFFFVLGLQIVAISIQMGFVVMLYATVVEEAAAPYENGLLEKVASITDALEKHIILDKTDPSLELCRKDHTLLGVHIMVLWIWISKMLREVEYAGRLMLIFWRVDPTPSIQDPEQKHTLRFLRNGGLCEPMNKARFLKQGKPTSASDKELEMSDIDYWNTVMEKVVTPDGVDVKATELRQDLGKLWSKGAPMTFPDLYDEMEGVVNGISKADRPTAEEFKNELEIVWNELDKVPYSATEIVDEDVVLNAKGELVSEAYTILYFTPCLRCIFIVFHGGLQMILATSLLFVSAKYLILANTMGKVILKAVSMQFIMTIDALIFSAFFPATFAIKIKAARIAYAGHRPSKEAQWTTSIAYVIISVLVIVLLRNSVFGISQEFRDACRSYYIANPSERDIPMDILSAISHAFRGTFAL